MPQEKSVIEAAVIWLNDVIWNPSFIWLCLGVGLFFSVMTRFAQVRHFAEMCRLLFRSDDSSEHGISSFQALSVSLSGRVGIGNIAGVAAAIGFGGPGAVFWMWVVASAPAPPMWNPPSARFTRCTTRNRGCISAAPPIILSAASAGAGTASSLPSPRRFPAVSF